MVGSTMLGTATTLTLMNSGSAILPLCIRALPTFTLYPELSLEVTHSRSLVEISRSKVMARNGSELTGLFIDGQEGLQEWNDSNTASIGDEDLSRESDVNNDLDTKTDSRSQGKENGLLNGFLHPFLALVTLKDTFLNFAYGAKLSYEPNNYSDQSDLESTDTALTQENTKEFCSTGPCLVDSWPNCWNVSVEIDWLTRGMWTEQNCNDDQPCCTHCSSNKNMKLNQGFQDGLYHRLDAASLKGAEMIHCCCQPENAGNSWLTGSLHSRIMDINLRFATQPLYPIFVTT